MNRRIKLTITTSLVVVAIIIGGVVAYMPSQGYAQNATSNTNSSSNGNTTDTNATSPSANTTSSSADNTTK
jgi:hypothetical protein